MQFEIIISKIQDRTGPYHFSEGYDLDCETLSKTHVGYVQNAEDENIDFISNNIHLSTKKFLKGSSVNNFQKND